MPYHLNYLTHLEEIINLINNNQIDGENNALEKFKSWILEVKPYGSYSVEHWEQTWREKVYELGRVLKNKNFAAFIHALDIELAKEENTLGNVEILSFIKSEIYYLHLPVEELTKYLLELIEQFPLNPEFRHSIGHLYRQSKEYDKAFAAYHYALTIDNKNISFINAAFNSEVDIVRNHIKRGEYEKAKSSIVNYRTKYSYLQDQLILNNFLVNLSLSIEDSESFDNRIKTSMVEVQEKIENTFSTERKRVIEIITIFAAIISFILSSVAIGKDFNLNSGLYFLTLLAFILFSFIILMNLFFIPQQNSLLIFFKVLIILILIACSYYLVLQSKSMVKDLTPQTLRGKTDSLQVHSNR